MNQVQDTEKQQRELEATDSGNTEVMGPNQQQQLQNSRRERTISPRASVYETPDEVVLELEMPGVNRDSIHIRVENDELSISGERTVKHDPGYELLHQERVPLNYRRSFVLSDRIASGNIKARCQDGVLELTLPKAAQAKPRRIEIE
jgi:HSP20 family protein